MVTFLAYSFNIRFNVDLTLLHIAIIFPLVFTIRGSFRRREKALEHLSAFRSNLKTVQAFLMSNNGLTEQEKTESVDILIEINETVLQHLAKTTYSLKELDIITDKVFQFTLEKDSSLKRSLRDKVFRFMRDVHRSIENLHSIHSHRTPISLKAYCGVFVYVFPFIYAPTIIYAVDSESLYWVVYIVVILTEFILISLYNIQDDLEYPFDNIGTDDINLDNFKISR
ncbi:hypothetical protein GCM10007028_26460 [Algibacter mikhailovii]|uniref:Uncharacterized protein n=1 Tax=Algibacter mikhailovii TaxID=425498 RepID=A0A918R542_9FLAO|nr:hypothetical protein GCM10007028_26460 [Algibacter mikhailovii]